ncbi:MAG: DUF885 domain-containing protein [Acidobacteria bacterium]|nr:MAG: DUF885 domain-containing protein [Acidobacteriota bacterium]
MRRLIVIGVVLLAGCGGGEVEKAADGAREQLHRLFAEEWENRLREDPLYATSVGRHDYDDRLPAMGLADLERRDAYAAELLQRLDAIDREALPVADQVSYDVFRRQLVERREDFAFGAYQMPLTVDSGFHTGFARLPAQMPFAGVADYRRYLARLSAWPRYVEEQIALMEMGLERGFTLPRVVLEGYEVTISSHVVEDPRESVFFVPFTRFPATVPEDERPPLVAAAEAAIRDAVVPGYRRFLDFMVGRYVPGARRSLGASELPDGAAYYAQRIRHFTTLDKSAEEIHRLGLDEVERIRGDMQAIIDGLGFAGDFAAFLDFLRRDPRFYAPTPEALLKEAAYLAKKMDGRLPSLFGHLPRQPYGVEPVPDDLAPKYTGGRYVPAPPGSRQAGTYWVNTYALDSRPLYVLPALTLHEAVPGHHLQIALAQELEDLPPFRRHDYISAFGEGWGLYAERLGLEAGFYDDPYSDFGRLTYEMWRACRLVVDTGLHAFGWSRRQAMDFLAQNTALSLHEVRTETDRYISWPGQALAYKIGELEIRRLRRRAEEELGARFDLRAFHDAVLANGSVPLPVLERQIERFIAEHRAAG